jgi:hypothetical protein
VNVTIGGGEDVKPIPLEDSLFADFNIDQIRRKTRTSGENRKKRVKKLIKNLKKI